MSYIHEWHMQQHNFLGPRHLGPWGGAKRSIIIKSKLQSQFQRFLNQSLCVFSQMKDMKQYQMGFSIGPLGHTPGVGLGVPWGGFGGQFFFEIQPDLVCELFT